MNALAEQVRKYGLATAPGLVQGSALAELHREAEQLVGQFTGHGYRSDDYWSFERADAREQVLYRIHNLEQQGSTPINELFADGPLHELAGEVLGREIRPMVCAMIVKMPHHAARVPWHRDRTSVAPHTVINLSLFLDDSSFENGCIEYVPYSHLLPDDADVTAVEQQGPVEAAPARAGDVLVHDVRTVHASRTNSTDAFRRSIVIEFAPVDFDLPNT
ncbi:phytanoyl-CoA dioxygenase family protein [Streptomyces sp. NBC_01381]|uniref:phytanoyl-CoA dioxygenase family protein n=1 Tax=Streptomyces sp. NBC_01381 TaxID=2903845 RepID=UPI0022505AE7|nr:phytanoyl-CoA dioxygenase family protein [Streptomyces sp. NBC_01381]MCX4666483.1 phytanoyl-CoA dioxygenase family protein [Streptomyces sp. NBC_01381]